MKNGKVLQFLMLFSILSGLVSGCGKSSVYKEMDSSYTPINNIDNLEFSIPLSFSNSATAITEISDESEYSSNTPYSFKNGKDEYVYFKMNELIILAQKGTSFHFDAADDKKECLNQSGVVNTWFSVLGKKFSYEESEAGDIHKLIADVNAEVVITRDLYGDYIGKLAVISDGTDEWSLFVGTVGSSMDDLSANQKEVLTDISKSMCLKDNPVEVIPEYDVVINQSLKETEDTEEAQGAGASGPAGNADEVIIMQNGEDDNIIPEKDISEGINTESSSAGSDTETSMERPASPMPSRVGMNRSNQLSRKREMGKAYQSDEYAMLSLGQGGILSATNENGISETPIIRINRIYTGDEAINKIRSLLNQNTEYKYFDAPEGYSWNVAEYDVSYDNCAGTPYINIKLVGVDGNPLVFRGIMSSKRTHDANFAVSVEENNIYGCLCYYPVPNGCKEYALECGDGTTDSKNTDLAAYYLIKISD